MARLAVSLLVWLAVLALPVSAAAHADLRSAEPRPGSTLDAPPAEVRLALGSEVESEFLELTVIGPSGRAVSGEPEREPTDAAAVRASLRADGDGDYLISWRALSRDGHPSSGSFGFSVGSGRAGGAATASESDDAGPFPVLARLLALTGPLLLLGLAVLRFGVVAPAWRSGGLQPAAGDAPAVRAEGRPALDRATRAWWLAWWASSAGAAVGLALLPFAVLASLDAAPGELGQLIGSTRFGAAWLVQAGALVLAGAGASLLLARAGWRRFHVDASWGWTLGLPPALALLAISWGGHASEGPDPELGIAIDAVHSLASAAWLGGLLGLVAVVPVMRGAMVDPPRVRLVAGVVVRFSSLAVAAVAAIVVTGVYRGLVELSSLGDLLDTAYGRALTVKLALVVLLLSVGAYSRFVTHPRLERAALRLAPDDRGASAGLAVSVSVELAFAAGVMVLVAALLSLPPPA